MALTPSTMLELGTPLPAFALPGLDGRIVTDRDFADAPVLVAFICRHCPYVTHIRPALAAFAREYQPRGLAVVAINANDAVTYPDDGPAGMKSEAESAGYTFPYLYDETQDVAREFHAACTPDFFLFDGSRRLAYRGEFDRSRPGGSIPVTGESLRAAAEAVLSGRAPASDQRPSTGCSIKWKRQVLR
jgi:thiol-disulfide isomerase/thioredoxin